MPVFSLQVLADNRDALLLAEVAAWLHMLGKFHEDFLQGDYELDVKVPPDLAQKFPELNKLLTDPWPGAIWSKLNVLELEAGQLSLFSLAEKHRDSGAPTGLQRLMWDAHGRGSGIEKGALNRFAPSQQNTVRLSTAYGMESAPIDLNALSKVRGELYAFLEDQLRLLSQSQAQVDWRRFRQEFIKRLEQDFRTTVAETRRPLNDVTLFDQTMASVAFFKAALARNLLCGWKEPNQQNVKDKYHWCILRVGLDGLAYMGETARVNDLLSRKALVDPALDDVRNLLEEIYPLGMEIYRDDNGSLYIVPDIADLLKWTTDSISLEEHLQQIAEQSFNGEICFSLEISKPTRNTLSFGQLATATLPPPAPFPQKVEDAWKGVQGRDICPVCRVRPQGPSQKALERKVCDVCEKRRSDRARDWAGKLSTTVWVDEAADVNGRVALIVGRFGLESWLSGEALSTVMAFDPGTRNLVDQGRNNISYQFDYGNLLQDIGNALSSRGTFGRSTPLLDKLLLTNQRGGFNQFSDIYDLYVSDTDLSAKNREPWRFALAIMRQQPSFARLRRIWETTRHFWGELPALFKDEAILPVGGRRLLISADNLAQLGLVPYHAYELDLDTTTLAVLCRDNDLITIDNLQRVARVLGAEANVHRDCDQSAFFVQGKLQHRLYTLIEPGEYGSPVRMQAQLHITQVEMAPEKYQPLLSILEEPCTFMALIPADRALDATILIKQKYQAEFGKVQNRLPLFLGLVFFPRKMPLVAVMDAGRRMLEQTRLNDEKWRVECNCPESSGAMRSLRLSLGDQWIDLTVPTKMGDGTTDDNWYPYFALVGNPAAHHSRRFEHMGRCWVHVGDLQPGDVVSVTPSRFAYLWLESTARRFAFDPKKDVLLLDELPRLRKMWEEICKSPNMSDTKLRAIHALFEAKRQEWDLGLPTIEHPITDGTYRHLIETTLRRDNVQGVAAEDVLSGRFRCCVDLYLHILKRRVKDEKRKKEGQNEQATV